MAHGREGARGASRVPPSACRVWVWKRARSTDDDFEIVNNSSFHNYHADETVSLKLIEPAQRRTFRVVTFAISRYKTHAHHSKKAAERAVLGTVYRYTSLVGLGAIPCFGVVHTLLAPKRS